MCSNVFRCKVALGTKAIAVKVKKQCDSGDQNKCDIYDGSFLTIRILN